MPQVQSHITAAPHPLFDTHGHYLFGIDDGSVDIDMSVTMVQQAQMQGITDIVCTSHNWGHQERYLHHFAQLEARLKLENIPVRLHPGSEIYCDPHTFPAVLDLLMQKRLRPMGNSRYVLLEFDPYTEPGDLLEFIRQVQTQTDFLPIVAHIERYLFLHQEPAALEILKRWEVPIQINAYSLAEETDRRIRGFAQMMLAERRVTFVGSDAHRTTHRPPMVAKGIEYICQTCSEAYANAVCYDNAARLLLG